MLLGDMCKASLKDSLRFIINDLTIYLLLEIIVHGSYYTNTFRNTTNQPTTIHLKQKWLKGKHIRNFVYPNLLAVENIYIAFTFE